MTRVLRQAPGFVIAVVLTLALGIGATVTVLSVVNGVLLRPVPYAAPGSLVQIRTMQPRLAEPGGNAMADYLDWRAYSRVFEHLAVHLTLDFNLPGDRGERPLPVRVTFASSELFTVLGVPAVVGRAFVHAEERPGDDLYTVVLSHDLWQRRFGGDAAVVGRIIRLDTTAYRVVGVMPRGFRFPVSSDAWAPLESWFDRFKTTMRDSSRGGRSASVVARLRAGVGDVRMRDDLDAIARRLEDAYPQTNAGVRFVASPLRDAYVGDLRPYLGPLTVAAAIVLVIACVNVANLYLGRAAERAKETAVRIALGVTRRRLLRDLLVEALAIAAIGAALGTATSAVAVRVLEASIPVALPAWMTFALDWRIGLVAALLAVIAAVSAGLAPVLQMARADHHAVLKEDGRSAGGRASQSWRSTLVVAQVAFALLLLVGAGLVLRTVLGLRRVDPGIRTDHLLVAYVSPPGDKYRAAPPYPAYASLYNQILERLRGLPAVESAAGARAIPYDGARNAGPGGPILLDGQSVADQDANPLVRSVTISSDYFHVAGIPLLVGEPFSGRETLDTPRVAIVSDAMARRLWPNADPIGRRIKPGGAQSSSPWHTIVGIVGDVRYNGLHADAGLTAYYPFTQVTAGDLHLIVRTRGAPLDQVQAMQQAIWSVDPDLAIYSLRTMESIVADSLWQPHLWGTVLAVFAGGAVALAIVGLYGVLSWSVRQRSREISLRLALGATPRGVLLLVVRQGLRLTLIGMTCGVVAAALATRPLEAVLFRVGRADPATWIGVAGLLVGVGLCACYLPARRAARADPGAVLR